MQTLAFALKLDRFGGARAQIDGYYLVWSSGPAAKKWQRHGSLLYSSGLNCKHYSRKARSHVEATSRRTPWKYYQGPPQAGARCGAGKLRQPAAWKGCATERALSSVRVLAAFQPPDGGFKRRPFPEGNRHRACKTAAVHP